MQHIIYHFELNTFTLDYQSQFSDWLSEVAKAEGFELNELNYIFCSDDYLLEVNQTHLDHDYYTDIITFDYSDKEGLQSDLFISVDRVEDNAKTYKVDFLNELARVMVHGLLHLCAYKDKSEAEAKEMRSKEDFYLKKINFLN
ncbi:MAG: rRNA maturation RNase YbeY [Flavobacteriales bacterium]